MAFSDLLAKEIVVPAAGTPLQPGVGQIKPRAKSVIFLFMEGGPSQMDLYDPKPLLNKLSGQRLPESFGSVITAMGESKSPLLASKRAWKQHGQSAQWFSDWIPHIASCSDDLAVIRSCKADGINHSAGVCQMNTGSILAGKPSLGSWINYGIGSENSNLPAFIVMQDNQSSVINGPRNWGAGFMPAGYQGVRITGGSEPIPNLNTPEAVSADLQKSKLQLIHSVNKDFAARYPDRSELGARLASYEMAARMQAEAPGVVDLTGETEATRKLYGLDDKTTEGMGRLCLLSRRMVEQGVRFVQIYHGAGSKWDAHAKIESNHAGLCASMDKPVAGLLKDLKSRGCSKTPSSSGAVNSAARRCPRKAMGATITPQALRCGWPAAASKVARPSAAPTTSACARSTRPCMYTTCMRPSSGCSVSIIWASPTVTKAGRNARPKTRASRIRRLLGKKKRGAD